MGANRSIEIDPKKKQRVLNNDTECTASKEQIRLHAMEKSKHYEPPKPRSRIDQLRELLRDPNLFVSNSDNPVGVDVSLLTIS